MILYVNMYLFYFNTLWFNYLLAFHQLTNALQLNFRTVLIFDRFLGSIFFYSPVMHVPYLYLLQQL